MTLFLVYSLSALMCAGSHLHLGAVLSSAAQATGTSNIQGDSDVETPAFISAGKSEGDDYPLHETKTTEKLWSPLRRTREKHTFALRRHVAKAADAEGFPAALQVEHQEILDDSDSAVPFSKEKVTRDVPIIGNIIPGTLPLVLERALTWQTSRDGIEKPDSLEKLREFGPLSAGKLASAYTSVPAVMVSEADDGIKFAKLKPSRQFSSKGRTEESTETEAVITSGKNGVKKRATRDVGKRSKDAFISTSFPQRGKCDGGTESCVSTDRTPKCEASENAAVKDCGEATTEFVDQSPVVEEGLKSIKEAESETWEANGGAQTEGKFWLAGHASRFRTTFVPKQKRVEEPCSSPPCPPSVSDVTQVPSTAPKKGRMQPSLTERISHPLLANKAVQHPWTDSGVDEVLARPSKSNHYTEKKPSCGCQSDMGCRCQRSCECQPSEERLDKADAEVDAADQAQSKHDEEASSEEANDRVDNPFPEPVHSEEDSDRIKLVRGRVPVQSGARIRGEPHLHGNLQGVRRPKLQPARSPTQSQLLHPPESSSTSTAAPGRLDELFMIADGQLGRSAAGTGLLRGRTQRQHQTAELQLSKPEAEYRAKTES